MVKGGAMGQKKNAAPTASIDDMRKIGSYHAKKKQCRFCCCLCVACRRRYREAVPSFVSVDHARVPKVMSQSLLCSYERREKTNEGENGLHYSGVVQLADLARRHYLGAISLQARVAFVATLRHGR